MRGYLQKTEEGWFVIYDQRTMQDPSAEDGTLPLHPKNASYLDMNLTSTTFLNEEIEFEQINLVDGLYCYQNCVFKTYAQLVTTYDHIVDANKMVSSAVEWLQQFMLKPLSQWPDDIWEQAKEMEKGQIMDAVNFGDERGKIITYSTAEQYYNETYNK